MDEQTDVNLLDLAATIVGTHVANNEVATADLPGLIAAVYKALATAGHSTAPATSGPPTPAVSKRASIKPDYLVCLEDGKHVKMLKRYLRTNYDMSPQDYRAKWGLPADYPMVAPNYAERRRELAKEIGLGRTRGQTPATSPDMSEIGTSRRRPGRPRKTEV